MTDTCQEWVPYGGRMVGGYTCGRPAKGTLRNGEPACGIHLRAERTREENADAADKARTADSARAALARHLAACVAEYAERSGLPDWSAAAHVDYSWRAREHTGNVVVRADVLRRLLGLED